MRNNLRLSALLFICILAAGCSRAPCAKDVLARVNDCEITRGEFEEEFASSVLSLNDTPESRKEFLDSLVDKKLILQDAEKKGLHKDRAFLRMVERFWEQSLLKIALDRKTKEIAGSSVVRDKEIKEVYDKMALEGRTAKPYADMYQQLRWELAKFKETQAIDSWIGELRRKAKIRIDKTTALKEK